MTRYHKTLVLSLALFSLTTTSIDAQEPQTFRACFVPQVGAMYLLDLPGLPTACLSEGHEEITWSEGGPLPDSSVISAMIATDAVDSTHIAAGAVGPSELNVRFERIETSLTVASNGTREVILTCADGREILSGGVRGSTSTTIQASLPSSDRTWYVVVRNAAPIPVPMTFAAVCADLG